MPLEDDPTDFDGVLPVVIPGTSAPVRKDSKSNAATGASAAGVRAFTAQAIAFYFRAPAKAFFRTRIDYLAYAKAINPRVKAGQWSFHTTTPGLLAHAIKNYGWRFIPDQLLPPLVANVAVGAVLYTSYLQILARLHEPSSHSTKRVFPPPPPSDTFTAGFLAGGFQSLIAAPLDALQVRFDTREAHYENKTMWQYGRGKLQEIGLRGVFAGWGLSFLKDSFGSGIFFMTFEYVKAQAYYDFIRHYYGSLDSLALAQIAEHQEATTTTDGYLKDTIIRPHYALEPAFLMLAGTLATITQQSIIYPLSLIQAQHYSRLELLDAQAKLLQTQKKQASTPQNTTHRGRMLKAYMHAYRTTWHSIQNQALPTGGLGNWLFRGFWWNTIRQVPSTSAGLVIFELVRRRYGVGDDEVTIQGDGYTVLLT